MLLNSADLIGARPKLAASRDYAAESDKEIVVQIKQFEDSRGVFLCAPN